METTLVDCFCPDCNTHYGSIPDDRICSNCGKKVVSIEREMHTYGPIEKLTLPDGEVIRHTEGPPLPGDLFDTASPRGKGMSEKDLDKLIENLEDGDEWVRFDAVGMLKKIGDVRAVDPLIRALGDADKKVGKAAVLALVELALVEPLLKALGDGNSAVMEVLGKIGDPRAVEPLLDLLRNDNSAYEGNARTWPNYAAAEALGEIGDVRAVQPLIETLEDENEFVRAMAAEALGKIGDARAVEPLIKTLRDGNYMVRYFTAEALGRIGDARAVEPLIEALKDGDAMVRYWAAKSLGEIGDTRAVAPLLEALGDDDMGVRADAAVALKKLGHEV